MRWETEERRAPLSRTFGVDLTIVDIEVVHPHEVPDPGRVGRLKQGLSTEGLLRDPAIVAYVEGMEGYLLLDGTNRRAALLELGCGRMLVQLVDYADRHCVNLLTWSHLVELPIETLLAEVARVDDIDVAEVDQQATDRQLEASGSLAAIHYGDRSWLISRKDQSRPSPQVLTDIVAVYEPHMRRESRDEESIAEKLSEVQSRPGGHKCALVTFPRLTRQQVARLAMRQTPIPAGITRHVIRCGRALRVNIPLDWLRPKVTGAEALEGLDQHLSRLRPRRYLEPTVLFDS